LIIQSKHCGDLRKKKKRKERKRQRGAKKKERTVPEKRESEKKRKKGKESEKNQKCLHLLSPHAKLYCCLLQLGLGRARPLT